MASRCIKTGELDRAEELLGQLSDTHRGKRELTARLRRKQGLHKESWILLEQELFDQAHTLQSTLLSMLDYALAEKDPQRARLLADTAVQAGEIFDLSDYAVLSAPFQLAAAEQDYDRFYDDEIRLQPDGALGSVCLPPLPPSSDQGRSRGEPEVSHSGPAGWYGPGPGLRLPPGGARLAGAAGPVSDLKLTEISP